VRVSAPDIEASVITAARNHFGNHTTDDHHSAAANRELIEKHIERIIVKPQTLEIRCLREITHGQENDDQERLGQTSLKNGADIVIAIPWTSSTAAIKGVLHSPSAGQAVSSGDRIALLTAIAKARAWVDDIVEGRVASFAEIAEREGKVERHIRLLTPLAFISPNILSALIDGAALSVGVTEFAKRISHSWAQRRIN